MSDPYIDAENKLLSALLKKPEAAHQVALSLKPKDFSSTENRLVFQAVLKVLDDGDVLDVVTLARADRNLNTRHLSYIEDLVPTGEVASHFAKIIRENSFKRQVEKFSNHLMTDLASGSYPLDEMAGMLRRGMDEIIENFLVGSGDIYDQQKIREIADLIAGRVNNPGIHGIRTLFPSFDGLVKGLKTLNLITAPTGFGKTALAMQWAWNIGVEQNIKCLYLNYEMEVEDLAERLLAAGGRIDLSAIQTGDAPLPDLNRTKEKLVKGSLYLSGCLPKTIDDTVNLIHHYGRGHGIKVVFIDYIGEISPRDSELDRGTYLVYGDWIQRIKDACALLGVKAVVMAQLNRTGVESNSPSIEHIGGSMQLIHKANVAVALYRDNNRRSVMKMIKNRGGPIPEQPIVLDYHKPTQHIEEASNSAPF